MTETNKTIANEIPSVICETSDECWKRLTRKANLYYEDGNFVKAELFYKLAMKEAEDIFIAAQLGTRFSDACPAPMLVASATNLTENLFQKGERGDAAKTLSSAIERMCSALVDKNAPADFLEECACHLGYAMTCLTNLMRRLGAPDDTIAVETQMAKDAFCVFSSRQSQQH